MTANRPRSEQLRFESSRTGSWILDTYLENAEIGNYTLAELMARIFDASGNPIIEDPTYIARQASAVAIEVVNETASTVPAGSVITVTPSLADPSRMSIVATGAGTAPRPRKAFVVPTDIAAGAIGVAVGGGVAFIPTLGAGFTQGSHVYVEAGATPFNKLVASPSASYDPWRLGVFLGQLTISSIVHDVLLLDNADSRQFDTGTGRHQLDEYIEAAEIGGKTLAELLTQLFDTSGNPLTGGEVILTIGPNSQFATLAEAKQWRDAKATAGVLLRFLFEAGSYTWTFADADSPTGYFNMRSGEFEIIFQGAGVGLTTLSLANLNTPTYLFQASQQRVRFRDMTLSGAALTSATVGQLVNMNGGQLRCAGANINDIPRLATGGPGSRVSLEDTAVAANVAATPGTVAINITTAGFAMTNSTISGYETGVLATELSQGVIDATSSIDNCGTAIDADIGTQIYVADPTQFTGNTVNFDPELDRAGFKRQSIIFDDRIQFAVPSNQVYVTIGPAGDFASIDAFYGWVKSQNIVGGSYFLLMQDGTHSWDWTNRESDAYFWDLKDRDLSVIIEGSSASSVIINLFATNMPTGAIFRVSGGYLRIKSITINATAVSGHPSGPTLASGDGEVILNQVNINDFFRVADNFTSLTVIGGSWASNRKEASRNPNPGDTTSTAVFASKHGRVKFTNNVSISGFEVGVHISRLSQAFLEEGTSITGCGTGVFAQRSSTVDVGTTGPGITGNTVDFDPALDTEGNKKALIFDDRIQFAVPSGQVYATIGPTGDFASIDDFYGWVKSQNAVGGSYFLLMQDGTHSWDWTNRENATYFWDLKDRDLSVVIEGSSAASVVIDLAVTNAPTGAIFRVSGGYLRIKKVTINATALAGSPTGPILASGDGEVLFNNTNLNDFFRVAGNFTDLTAVGGSWVSNRKEASRNPNPGESSSSAVFASKHGRVKFTNNVSISGFEVGVLVSRLSNAYLEEGTSITGCGTGVFAQRKSFVDIDTSGAGITGNTVNLDPAVNVEGNKGALIFNDGLAP